LAGKTRRSIFKAQYSGGAGRITMVRQILKLGDRSGGHAEIDNIRCIEIELVIWSEARAKGDFGGKNGLESHKSGGY